MKQISAIAVFDKNSKFCEKGGFIGKTSVNMIYNFMTIGHMNMAEHIFRKDVATQKRKSIRPRSSRVIEDHIEISK